GGGRSLARLKNSQRGGRMSETAQQGRKRPYTASLIGNIRAILTGLQGFSAIARELLQNADDARAEEMVFDIVDDALRIWNSGKFSSCETQDGHCPWEVRGNPNSEPPRDCRRPFGLSYAAMETSSSMA